MSSWIVELTHRNGKSAQIALIDSFGPSNKWKELVLGSFLPGDGDFLNQLKRVAPA